MSTLLCDIHTKIPKYISVFIILDYVVLGAGRGPSDRWSRRFWEFPSARTNCETSVWMPWK